ncbi:MAG: protein phosphatase 2C domain-containing protein [Actinomycetota bacterium]|nr:protein phosphatase 2C domain-containing protein [Actinomycetota bacterium]
MDRVLIPTRSLGPLPHARRLYRFQSAALSHVGRVRQNNEDFVLSGQNLIAVADGVGGNVFGEVASEVVVAAIAYLEDRVYIREPGAEVSEALNYANERLAQAVEQDHDLFGMASTLTALRLDGSSLMVLHVGDSRAYLSRNSECTRLTRDDSLVQGLVDLGEISDAEATRHPARSVVLQALNGGPVRPYVAARRIEAGDRYLVCSDGLSDYVGESTIGAILAGDTPPADCCAALVEAALAVGAPDNVSCVVGDVTPLDGPN